MPFVLIDGSPLAYLSTDGGPLFLISQHLLPFWEGAPIEESEPGEMRDDYWRACELSLATRGWLADLPVGPGTALLLTGGEMQTAWQHTSDGGLLVRWEYGESQEEVAAHVLRLRPSFPWKPTPHVVEATDEPLYVSSPVLAGGVIASPRESLSFSLPAGRYSVSTLEYEPDTRTRLIVHRLGPRTSESPDGAGR